jgi:Tol biopolymer transport system component
MLRAHWSPDGKRIAYSEFVITRSGVGESELFSIGIHGWNRVRITHTAGAEQGPTWQPIPWFTDPKS